MDTLPPEVISLIARDLTPYQIHELSRTNVHLQNLLSENRASIWLHLLQRDFGLSASQVGRSADARKATWFRLRRRKMTPGTVQFDNPPLPFPLDIDAIPKTYYNGVGAHQAEYDRLVATYHDFSENLNDELHNMFNFINDIYLDLFQNGWRNVISAEEQQLYFYQGFTENRILPRPVREWMQSLEDLTAERDYVERWNVVNVAPEIRRLANTIDDIMDQVVVFTSSRVNPNHHTPYSRRPRRRADDLFRKYPFFFWKFRDDISGPENGEDVKKFRRVMLMGSHLLRLSKKDRSILETGSRVELVLWMDRKRDELFAAEGASDHTRLIVNVPLLFTVFDTNGNAHNIVDLWESVPAWRQDIEDRPVARFLGAKSDFRSIEKAYNETLEVLKAVEKLEEEDAISGGAQEANE